MSKHYNDFCKYCVGNELRDIRECDDRACPFFQFRYGGLEPGVEKDICKKLIRETGMVTW